MTAKVIAEEGKELYFKHKNITLTVTQVCAGFIQKMHENFKRDGLVNSEQEKLCIVVPPNFSEPA